MSHAGCYADVWPWKTDSLSMCCLIHNFCIRGSILDVLLYVRIVSCLMSIWNFRISSCTKPTLLVRRMSSKKHRPHIAIKKIMILLHQFLYKCSMVRKNTLKVWHVNQHSLLSFISTLHGDFVPFFSFFFLLVVILSSTWHDPDSRDPRNKRTAK